MKLLRVRIRNFRCFKNETAIDFDDITALIGKNDAGKSSVMEALDIFLNENLPDKHDAAKGGDANDLTIICEFGKLPTQVIIDDQNPTSLSDEFLLNPDGRLEIHKTFSGHLQKPQLNSVSAYAVHPTSNNVADLLQLKNSDLKERARALRIDLSGIDQKVNAQLRAKIRIHIDQLDLQPQLISLNEKNAKNIWEGLRKYLPVFFLFKSDRASSDQDPEAQDPLKAAVKEAIKNKETELRAITSYIESEVEKIAHATLGKLQEMDPSLATQLHPQFTPPKWDTLFKASITGDDDIPINKRGSGVKRLILLNFFRAKAEQQAKESGHSYIIYGIEEPETSQHPHNQRMLLKAFTELSMESQVIISTHTPMLARSLSDNCLRYIHVRDNKVREVKTGGEDTNKLFAKALGVLPDNHVKLFIGVEGKHDISFLQTIASALLSDQAEILDLQQMELNGELIFFPLGGSNLALWTSRLEHLNRPEFHLYDRDFTPPAPAKYQSQVDEVNRRDRCKAISTAKKEIENYLHKDAIINAYSDIGIALTINTNFSDFDDVPAIVAKLIHEQSESQTSWESLSNEQKGEKSSRAKKVLNAIASKHMTKQMLIEIDPHGDLLGWFDDMKDLLRTT